jgi:hypothetical protein
MLPLTSIGELLAEPDEPVDYIIEGLITQGLGERDPRLVGRNLTSRRHRLDINEGEVVYRWLNE